MTKKILALVIILAIAVAVVVAITSCKFSKDAIDASWQELDTTEVDKVHQPQNPARYNPLTGEVKDAEKETFIPEGSIYLGYSLWDGYIFQHGDAVFCVFPDEEERTIEVKNVTSVLSKNHYVTHDAFSCVVVLKNNGDVYGIIPWDKKPFLMDWVW